MQQSSKQWIIAISIILIAALFVLFVPYGKDAAVYRMTKSISAATMIESHHRSLLKAEVSV